MGHLDSLKRSRMLCLDLPFGFDADCILRPLAMNLSARGVGHLALMQPLDGKKHAHILTDSCAVVTCVEKGCETRTLPFDEKILRREHEQLAFNRAAYDLLLNQALSALHDAKEKHDVLERIYADAMDYRRLDDMQANMVQRMTRA